MDLDELDELDPVEEVDLSTQERPYGVVIYGASGYTGCLMAEHLDALLSRPGARPMRWAIAGRNANKLRHVARRCQTSPDIIQAAEPLEVSKMVEQARVVVAAAGPYRECGEDVIRECLNQVTHYIDITGEVAWMHDMIAKYHEKARAKGVMIVQCAGAVCAPNEIMCYSLVKKLGPLKRYREYYFQYGAVSGGTLNSNIATMAHTTPEALAVQSDPFSLGGARECGVRPEDEDLSKAEQDPLFPSLWQMPAYNAPSGTRIIRRSCALFEEMPADDGLQYGREFSVAIRDGSVSQRTAEAMVAQALPAPSPEIAIMAAAQMREGVENGSQPPPGRGAPAATRAVFSTEAYAVAEAESGEWAHAHYASGEAYEVTAMTAIAGAMVLVEELDRVRPRERGGVLGPAFALHGSTWIERILEVPFACGAGSGCKVALEVLDGLPAEEDIVKAAKRKTANMSAGQAQILKGEIKAWV